MAKLKNTEENRLLGNRYFAQKKYTKALKEYLKIFREAPDDPSTNITLGEIHVRMGQFSEAVAAFSRAADRYRQAGFFSKAMVLYQKICRIDPDNLGAREHLVGIHLLKRDDAESSYWRRKHEQNACQELREMARTHLKKSREAQAMAYYQRTLQLDPFDVDSCIALARLHAEKRQKKQAKALLSTMADRLLDRKLLPEARKVLEVARQHDDEDPEILTLSAHTQMAEGNVDSAIGILKDLLDTSPECANAHRVLGQAYLSKNQLQAAQTHILRAFEISCRQGIPVDKTVVLLEDTSSHLLERGKVDSAFEAVGRMADFLSDRGESDPAIEMLKRFTDKAPQHLKSHQRLLAAYRAAGQEAQAQKTSNVIFSRFLEQADAQQALSCLEALATADPQESRWKKSLADIKKDSSTLPIKWSEPEEEKAPKKEVTDEVEILDLSDDHQFVLPGGMDLTAPLPQHAAAMEPLPQESPSIIQEEPVQSVLPKRAIFMDRLAQALITAKRNMSRVVLLLVGVHRSEHLAAFPSRFNARQLNLEAENRLLACLRKSDTVGRLGVDEFGVILQDVHDPVAAERVAAKIIRGMAAEFLDDAHSVPVLSCSVGITVYPDDAHELQLLLKHADTAMERAKNKLHSSFAFYTKAMDDEAERRVSFERDMFRALNRGEFLLYYQPIMVLETQEPELMGVEALLRWQHPELGFLLPGEFLHQAEETKLINQLGRWVLDAVLRQVAQWYRAGFVIPAISVNVSGIQWRHPDFEMEVQRAMRENELPQGVLQLRFESSQTVMNDPGDETFNKFQQIRHMGVSLTVDDFGKGHASLVSLNRSPVDMVKIDRSFIEGIVDDEDSASITRALVATAHSLKMRVVAEGIETDAQLAFLKDLGCDFGQGYLFSEPLSPKDLEARYLTQLPEQGD